jgi:hypothetical protein
MARTFRKVISDTRSKENDKNMKKIGLILGGLFLLLASTASATGTLCGTAGGPDASVGFTGAVNGPAGSNASTNASGDASFTCNAFTVPANETLTSVTFYVTDDATQALDASSQITWQWTYTGQALTPTPGGLFSETGTGSFASYGPCGGTGTLVCDSTATFTTTSLFTAGMTTGSFTFGVAPKVVGDGLGPFGTDNASVSVIFNTSTTSPAPEPASLLLIGSGLIGLGVLARRKRRS